MPDNRIEVAEALEQLILTLMREALTCGVTEASINDLAQHTMDNRATILAALRDAGTGRDSGGAEAMREALTEISRVAWDAIQRADINKSDHLPVLALAGKIAQEADAALPLRTGSDVHE